MARIVLVLAALLGALACDRASKPDFEKPDEAARGAIGDVRCARSQGRVACQGRTAHGVLGTGLMEATQADFVEVPGLRNVRAIVLSLMEEQACAVAGSEVHCWGDRWAGGPIKPAGSIGDFGSPIPERVAGIPPIAAISAGLAHICALTVGGEVLCWGDNVLGAIVDPATDARRHLPPTGSGVRDPHTRYIQVLAGPNQTCALTDTRDVYCWGGALERDGKLVPAFTPTLAATAVTGLHRDARLRVCAVTDGGERCWTDTSESSDHAHEARRRGGLVTPTTP